MTEYTFTDKDSYQTSRACRRTKKAFFVRELLEYTDDDYEDDEDDIYND